VLSILHGLLDLGWATAGGGSPVTTMTRPGGGQPSLRWRLLLRTQAFEFARCAITGAAVQAAYVVPALQEGEDAPPGLIMGIEVFAHEQLGFERAEERLAHRIVIGVACGAHRWLHACLAAAASEGNRRMLTPLSK
jgi:hypothetical protein